MAENKYIVVKTLQWGKGLGNRGKLRKDQSG